jgi:DNA-damage-inducible protein J
MNDSIRIRIDKDTKEKAEKALKKMGLSLSSAIRLYLYHVVKDSQKELMEAGINE